LRVSEDRAIAVEAAGLTRRFGEVVAVDGLNVKVPAGEVFGLVGPDGAGKTTSIRMLCGIMRPSSGSARVAGYDVETQGSQIRRRIGYMAQRFSLYGDLTVVENLEFFSDLFHVPRGLRRRREQRLLEFARLTEFRKRRAGQLSGGMQKKLALACSLIHEPDIIFLDEPTTGVDPVSRREFWDLLSELHLQDTTVFVSTPYMDEAERCSRVGLLYRGRLVICETPDRIKGMLSGDLLELRASELRRAQQVATALQGVLEVQTYGDLLHVFVDDTSLRERALVAALQAAGIEVHGLRKIRPRMEEAFVSLIRQQVSAESCVPVVVS
jgi:ABC-2 type transport system ATP-binding protein